jgi:hypothetical protein
MWHVINKEVGKFLNYGKKIELYIGTKIITNPQNMAYTLDTFL